MSSQPETNTPVVRTLVRYWYTWLFWPVLALLLVVICGVCVFAAPQRMARSTAAGDAERFFYGLGEREQNDAGSFRWSGRDWGVALFGAAYTTPTLVTIQASATRPADVQEALLRRVGTPAAAAFPVSREPRRYRFLVRPSTDPNDRQRIDFVGTTFTPDGSDGRALGIAISRVEVTQLRGFALLPLVARSLFLAGVAFGIAAALRQLRLSQRASFGIGLLAAATLGGVHMYDPQTLGFVLPNTWLMLASVGAVLLVLPVRQIIARTTTGVAQGRVGRIVRLRRLSPLFGFGVALVGTLALWLQVVPIPLGLTPAIAGALLVAIAGNGHREREKLNDEQRTANDSTPYNHRSSLVARLSRPAAILFLITLFALAARLYRLNDQPLALWRDEVYHAELALRIWHDAHFRPVYVPDVDLPALLFYLIAPPIGLFGADLWTLRLVPALAGALTPLALWFALRPIFGQRVALIAAWCMAVAAWNLYMSRWTFPVILDPLLTLVAIGCLWRGLGTEATAPLPRFPAPALLLCALGGMCTGLVVYTYHTGRIEPLAIGMVVGARFFLGAGGWRLGSTGKWQNRKTAEPTVVAGTTINGQSVLDKPQLPRPVTRPLGHLGSALAVALLAFTLTSMPLAVFALNNPEAFSKRFATVSIFNGPDAAPTAPLTVLSDQLERHALMWHVRGDQNARHYAPFRPMIDPFSGALLLVGLCVCLLLRRNVAGYIVIGWLAIGVLPGLFSDVAPHAMRTIGALAPTCALIALGLDTLQNHVASSIQHAGALRRYWWQGVVGSLLVGIAAWNLGLYFSVTGDVRENYYAFETQRSWFARAARSTVQRNPLASVYLPEVLRTGKVGQTTTLLLGAAPVGWLAGNVLNPPAHETAVVLLPGDSNQIQIAAAQQALGPAARLLRTGPPMPNQTTPIYLIYGVGRDAQRIADAIALP